jgi:hypothetical protein
MNSRKRKCVSSMVELTLEIVYEFDKTGEIRNESKDNSQITTYTDFH